MNIVPQLDACRMFVTSKQTDCVLVGPKCENVYVLFVPHAFFGISFPSELQHAEFRRVCVCVNKRAQQVFQVLLIIFLSDLEALSWGGISRTTFRSRQKLLPPVITVHIVVVANRFVGGSLPAAPESKSSPPQMKSTCNITRPIHHYPLFT